MTEYTGSFPISRISDDEFVARYPFPSGLTDSEKETLIREIATDVGSVLSRSKFTTATFIGYTPSFNDGDICRHSMLPVFLNGINTDGEEDSSFRAQTLAAEYDRACADRRDITDLLMRIGMKLQAALDTNFRFTVTLAPNDIVNFATDYYDCGF